MTIWPPQPSDLRRPLYLAIADALARAIEHGELEPGDRLPTQRALARQLGVTVGTVGRGYAEAEWRGLVVGEVGRGTFVRGPRPADWASGVQDDDEEPVIDLALNFPTITSDDERILAETLRTLACETDRSRLLAYQRFSGSVRQREAGAELARRSGLPVDRDRVLVCAGAQHALNVVLATLTRPGDLVLTEALTYPGIKSLGRLLGLRLRGLPTDDGGLLPEPFERACAAEEVRALYVIPTLQNPTGSIMPVERRRAIAEIARRHDVPIVEDDVHGLMVERAPPPIAAFAKGDGFYIVSTGKALAPSLRIAYLAAPCSWVERMDAGVRATTWMASPLTAEIAAMWIEHGTIDEILAAKRAALAERQALFDRVLGGYDYVMHPSALHAWLRLPEPWRSDEFIEQARARGVRVTGAGTFAVGRQAVPHAVRICVAAPACTKALERGLEVLREILEGRAEPCGSVV